jgi:hypothetical protein
MEQFVQWYSGIWYVCHSVVTHSCIRLSYTASQIGRKWKKNKGPHYISYHYVGIRTTNNFVLICDHSLTLKIVFFFSLMSYFPVPKFTLFSWRQCLINKIDCSWKWGCPMVQCHHYGARPALARLPVYTVCVWCETWHFSVGNIKSIRNMVKFW